MSEHSIYCAACNSRFSPKGNSRQCPRCQADVPDLTNFDLDQTFLIRSDEVPTGNTEIDPLSRPESQMRPEPDDFIGRQVHVYACERLLGEGGMGRVYLAKHVDLGRRCALKILSPKVTDGDIDYVRRFQHEGKAAAALVHKNIVTVHAIGESDGVFYLEMEFVPGRSLQQLVEKEKRLGPVRATVLTLEIAHGLAAAHGDQIIHRDLKADNILLTHRGVPKIADFGLAKRVLDDDGLPSERIVGTPHYMAPELFHGSAANPTSDVYALGVCYYFMLTGEYPFSGNSYRQMRTMVETQPLPNVREKNPEITLAMSEMLNLLMEKSPANRPKSATEALQLIQAVLGEVKDLETLLDEAFAADPNVQWAVDGDRYRIDVSLPDGRGQRVFMEATGNTAAERLLSIYSICCNDQPDYYEQALRMNSQIPHGGLAIREIDGESYFVMIDTYPRGTVSADAVRRSVLEVAYQADSVELLLTGLDIH